MEQAVTERPLSQEQQLSHLPRLHNGTVDKRSPHLPPDPHQRQFPRRWNVCYRTNVSTGGVNGENLEGDKRICRDYTRGKCARGSSCKFRHDDGVGHDKARFWNQQRELNSGSASENTHFQAENRNDNLLERSSTDRSRSLCRKFQSGTCYRGSSCPYLHSGCTDYGRPIYLNLEEHHRVSAMATNPYPHKQNLTNNIRTFQGQDTANKGNNLRPVSSSREHESRSPCRNFLRGKCRLGASCKRLHLVDDYNQNWNGEGQPRISASDNPSIGGRGLENLPQRHFENDQRNHVRSGSFSEESRKGFLCQYFLRGYCNQGSSCVNLHPVTVYERTRYDLGPQYHQGPVATPRYHQFHERNSVGELQNHGIRPFQDKRVGGAFVLNDVQCNEHHKPPRFANEPLADDREFTSRGRSCDPPRGRPVIDVGHDKLRPQVCLKFTKGRCGQGEHCKYLHSYHEYASSVSERRRRPQSEDNTETLGASMENQCVTKLVPQEQCNRSEMMSSHDSKHTDRNHVSADGTFSEKTNTQSINDAMLKAVQKDQELVIVGNEAESSAAGNVDVNLMTRPFKRQRSRSRSPFSPESNFRCQKLRRDHPQGDFPGRRCYQEAQIQCSNEQQASVATNSVAPSSHAECDSNMIVPEGAGQMATHRIHLDQCLGNSPLPGTAIVSKTSMDDSAANSSQPSHTNQNYLGLDTDCIMVNISGDATALSQEPFGSDLKCSSEQHLITSVNTAIVSEKDEVVGGNIPVNHEGKELAEAIKVMKTYSRKRKSKQQPGSSTLAEEGTDTSSQRLPVSSSIEGTSLDHPGDVSISEVTADFKTGDVKCNVSENIMVKDHPMKRNRNRVIIVKVPDDAGESSSAATRKKLLVLDVNGLLADIVGGFPDKYKPDTTVSGKGVFKRPFCDEFLQFCFARFDVGIWSSRNKKNVNKVVDFLLKHRRRRLLFCWDQSHCTETGYKTVENQEKPLVLKELKKLWEKKGNNLPWKKGFYNETNTILLDDSPYKALRNPPYTAVFPFPYSYQNESDNSLGPDGDLRLYLTRLAEAEDVQKFIQDNPFGQRPITKANLSWAFYSKIVGSYTSQQHEENVCKVPDSS